MVDSDICVCKCNCGLCAVALDSPNPQQASGMHVGVYTPVRVHGCMPMGIHIHWTPPPSTTCLQDAGFDAEELEHLLCALFENSEHRRAALARVRASAW